MAYKQKMTFGFEIEGYFKKGLKQKLLALSPKSELKTDGSVDFNENKIAEFINLPPNYYLDNNIVSKKLECLRNDSNEIATEINSGVFSDYKKMLHALSIFNDKNYFGDKSCGIHIHLGFGKDKISRAKLADLKMIKTLQDFALEKLCPCISDRLTDGEFCYPYQTELKKNTINEFERGEKYRFMRNHGNTFEFRFFSCCKHRNDNIEKFFNFLFKQLEKYNPKVKRYFMCDSENGFDNTKNVSDYQVVVPIYADTHRIAENESRLVELIFNLSNNVVVEQRQKNNNNSSECIGYHNDCSCETCEREGWCLNDCCQECNEDGCGNPHCEECGNDAFCGERDCEYCQENNTEEWQAEFGDLHDSNEPCNCDSCRQARGTLTRIANSRISYSDPF